MMLSSKSRWYLLLPLALIVAAAGIAPFVEAMVTSFFHDVYGQRSFAGLENYRFLLSDAGFSYSMNISFLWAAANTLLGLFVSILIAWRLHRKGREGSLLYASLVIPWAVPVYIAVPLWRSFFHGDGGMSLFSTLTGLHINLLTDPKAAFLSTLWVSVWMSVPFTSFILRGSLGNITDSLKDAARIDGADSREILQFIYLPQIKGMLAVMAVLNFIKYLKEFNLIYLMTSGGPPLVSGITDRFIIGATTTLDILIYEIFQTKEDLGISSAYAVCLAAVVLLIMVLWVYARKERSSKLLPSLVCGISQLPFSGLFGVIPAALYLLGGLRSRNVYRLTLLLQTLYIAYRIHLTGFLEGFSPGILTALLVYVLFISDRRSADHLPETIRTGKMVSLSFDSISILLSGLFLLSAVLMVFMLIWLSISGLGSSYIDSLIPPFPTLSNYVRIVFDEGILTYFLNTLILSTFTAAILPFCIMPASYFLQQRGHRTAFALFTFLQILGLYGGMHSLIPLYGFFRRLQLIDSYIPLVLIYLNHAIPSALFTAYAYLQKLPASFEEQARLEGISPIQYFRLILFPISLPIIAVNMVLAFIAAWNGFMAPLLFLTTESKFPISVKLFSLVGNLASGFPKWNLFAAASVINCLIISLLFYRFRKPLGKNVLQERV